MGLPPYRGEIRYSNPYEELNVDGICWFVGSVLMFENSWNVYRTLVQELVSWKPPRNHQLLSGKILILGA